VTKNTHKLSRNPLDEESDGRRDSCMKTHNNHKTDIYMPPEEFEPAIPASKWPQSDASEQPEMQTQNAVRILTDGNRRDVSVCTVHVYVCHTVLQCTESSMCCNWFCIGRYFGIYTGCPRRNVPDFGRVFLMLKYIDITQNTYVQS